MTDEEKRTPESDENPTEDGAEKTEAEAKRSAARPKPKPKKKSSKKAPAKASTAKKTATPKPAEEKPEEPEAEEPEPKEPETEDPEAKEATAAEPDEPEAADTADPDEPAAAASSEPLPEDESAEPVSSRAAPSDHRDPLSDGATEAPPVPPHYRSRHPQPPPQGGGGGGRVTLLVLAVIAIVFVILSLANSRSYQIVEEDGQAVLSKGYFLPAGSRSIVPDGASTAFSPIPWITPPQGSVTRGNLREVTGTYYALLYLAAGEAMEDDALFDEYDQQAAGLEAWHNDRFGSYPDAAEKMHDLRYRVRNRRTATKEFVERREAVLQQIEELIASVPEHASPAVLEDITRFEAFLAEERAASF